MNPIAKQLNEIINDANPYILEMLSSIGKNLFFPKGILQQSAEAKEKAHKINATIGIAKEGKGIMHFPSVMSLLDGITPEESLTYAPSYGIPALRKVWKESIFKKNPSIANKQISLPVVTCGITNGISVFGDVWVDPGDSIILPEMMWGNYNMILNVRRGAQIVNYPTFQDNKAFNVKAFEQVLKEQAKKSNKIIALLNFPHNPTGYTATEEESQNIANAIIDVAESGKNVIAVFDDSYFGLFYDEACAKESVFSKVCGAHPRIVAIKLDGATKESFVWGLRVGFITYGINAKGDMAKVYDALERKTAGDIRGNISNASHLSQSVILKSMQNPNHASEFNQKYSILKKRALRVKEVLNNSKYNEAWSVYPFNSGYFMCIQLKTVDAETLRVHLLNNYGVGLIALGEKNIRVAFSCIEENEVEDLFDIILKGVEDLKK
ncbi:MAG: aminotransferase class I/II-fold pyridoxal phosphate-dependent enzyme [Desulfobacterales bacterium]|nr:aminotransferase class I/II-fold pyridoxal phosphate-dependent enzyme [Desulfobacterales bacterium]